MLAFDILDDERRAALPKLKTLREDFYLAGGTALALQLGHRDSVDFDFFSERSFDTSVWYARLRDAFGSDSIVKTQEEKDTLSVVVQGDILISLFSYPYPLIELLVEDENMRLAGMTDIGCMKLSAIISRSSIKDYVDLYFILKRIPLVSLLESAARKMPDLDRNLVLKSLAYFEDIREEPLSFKHGQAVSLDEVRTFLTQEVQRVAVDFKMAK